MEGVSKVSLDVREYVSTFETEFQDLLQNNNNELQDAHQNHLDVVSQHNGTIAALKTQLAHLNTLVEQQHAEADSEKQKCEQLEQEVKDMTARSEQLPLNVRALQEQRVNEESNVLQQSENVMSIEQEKEFKLNELKCVIVCYRDILGLDFETVSGNLRVSFHNIDPNDSERHFWFELDVDADNKYTIQEVNPEVPDLGPLTKHLNTHNDFGFFVQAMRRKFKALL